MELVKVTPRNRNFPCRECGRKVGDVADQAYATTKYGSKKSATYCYECGKTKEVTTKKFECLQCGSCCRNLRVNMGEWTLGLFLLPDETKFFPEDKIFPMWAIGLKGRSRPRPETIGVFQLDSATCIHMTEKNTCRIYDKRPVICHAHPLSLTIEQDRTINASVNASCKGARKIPSNTHIKLSDYFSDDIIKASAAASAYLQRMFHESAGLIWLFDLRSHKWKRVTETTVIQLKA